ncbi:GapA-binding peptide SR1P [Paenibacillus ginsengihumi]|uniref:GapA-binding peptide SR1P n=1 Tax=Paenibacillus ginsengihumi TaxID=431596 RepID=UPI00035E1C25|nr:GapA-binding peptide SR1P [Paenibacillus ginsengihumi]
MTSFNNPHAEVSLHSDIHDQVEQQCELGILICKICGQVIDTLPTNGVKKIYGVCSGTDCRNINRGEKQTQ